MKIQNSSPSCLSMRLFWLVLIIQFTFVSSGNVGLYQLSASLWFHIVSIRTSVCVCAAFIGVCPPTPVINCRPYFKLWEPIKSLCLSQNPWKQIKSHIDEIRCCFQLGAIPTQAVGKCCLVKRDVKCSPEKQRGVTVLLHTHTHSWKHTNSQIDTLTNIVSVNITPDKAWWYERVNAILQYHSVCVCVCEESASDEDC